jgi:hypothetical protein
MASSKEFLLWLLGGWIFYYVTSFFLVKEAFAGFMDGLGRNHLIQIPYMIFLLSVFLNIFRVFRERLKRGRIYALFSIILPLGAAVFLVGFFMSASLRRFEWKVVGEGQTIQLPWERKTYLLKEIRPALKEETLESEAGESGIFQYEPKTIISDGVKDYEVGAFPPSRINGTYYHILNFDLAPGVRLKKGGDVLDEGYMMLRLLPPGSLDYFEMQPYPYRFSIKIAPEKIIEKGETRMRLYSLRSLSYDVAVQKGESVLFEGNSKGEISFEGLSLSFFEPSYWVLLDIVRDRGVVVMLSGLIIIAAGLPLCALSLMLRRPPIEDTVLK